MWYNKDALKKAGLPEAPPKTWPEVFEAAKKLKAAGFDKCGFSTGWTTWANIEQLGAWHNVPVGTKANGFDGFDTEFKINSDLFVKHLTNLVELQKDKTYDYSGRTNTGEGRFTSGECPIFLTSSAFFGNVNANAKFDWANAPMPYYPEVAGRAAELDHRRRLALGDGRQEGRRVQGRRQVLHLPLRCRPAGEAAHRVRAICRSPRRPTRRSRLRASTRTSPISRPRCSSSTTRSRPRIRAACASAASSRSATSGRRRSRRR